MQLSTVAVIVVAAVGFATRATLSQQSSADCPRPWVAEGNYCYLFSFIAKTWSDARLACAAVDARLIAVTESSKHFFVWQHLNRITNSWSRSPWYTGGRRQDSSTESNPVFEWVGAGPVGAYQFWMDLNAPKTPNGDYIVYKYSDTDVHTTNPGWFWVRSDGVTRLPYICEVEKANAGKIMTLARGFDYGEYNVDPERVPRGPRFVVEPEDVVASEDAAGQDPADTSTSLAISLECEASGYPQPTYKWFAVSGFNQEQELRPSADYMLTNGRLTIHRPLKTRDAGLYYCTATNQLGTIRSRLVSLSFIVLSEFPREPMTTYVRAYDHAVIPCKHNNPPTIGLNYHWYFNNDPSNWINTDANPHFFPSKNGNFYIGFATAADANVFHCQISLPSSSGGVSRSSPAYTLAVLGGDAKTVEPVIDSPFPLVYPSSPLPKTGETVYLECFARGTFRQGTQYDYSWSRVDGKPLPDRAALSEANRLMTIIDAHPEDAGVYTCTVNYYGYQTSKNVELKIQVAPYFGDSGLQDMHVDEGQTVVWPCTSAADPQPTIQWLKNGRPLAVIVAGDSNSSAPTTPASRITLSVSGDELTIRDVSRLADAGMYQCVATSSLGVAYTSAQLRVVAFPPNFINRPMANKFLATIDGNVTLACDPDGAPMPKLTWRKDGSALNLDGGTRIRQLANGHLFISRVQALDAGVYTCEATNRFGVANSSVEMVVRDFTKISFGPRSATYIVNSTVILQCRADYNRDFDIQYLWERNGAVIDFEDWRLSRIYQRDMKENRGGLIIKRISFEEAGYYRCIARTISDEAWNSAEIRVVGPPNEPAGLIFDTVRSHAVHIQWQRGHDGGSTIFAYTVEICNLDSEQWRFAKNVTDPQEVSLTNTTLDDPQIIFADTSYRYRVKAQNAYGIGPASSPSAAFRTLPAKPSMYPNNIGGGGGKVGTLVITWDLLEREMWNGPNLRYRVSFRHNADRQWSYVPDLKHSDLSQGRHSELIHARNYYTIYYVRVQAINDIGDGPIPEPVAVYSAEDVPIIQPLMTNCVAYNASALLVYWSPVPDSVQDIRGKLLGFNIMYWPIKNNKSVALRKTIFGNVTEGIIIGLEPYSEYNVEVQLFNSAGDSATGRRVQQKTWKKEPQTAPLFVRVDKMDGLNRVKISWQGVQTYASEEPLDGYKVRIWKQGEHISSSTFYEAGRQTWLIIDDLRPENSVLYNVRVMGYSRGGLGKMSSPLVQFQFGCDSQYVNPEAQYIRQCSDSNGAASTSSPATRQWLLLLSAIACIFWMLQRPELR